MTAADFGGRGFDFAVGEVHGLRSWRMDELGRLRAVHIPMAAPWRPGVNVAECLALPTAGGGLYIGPHGAFMVGTFRTAIGGKVVAATASDAGSISIEQDGDDAAAAPEPEPEPKHAAPDEGCSCGFYAYTHQPYDTYGVDGTIVGIIRGSGRTLIGTKGFRCEKAEILALLDPAVGAPEGIRHWQRDRLRAVYPDVPLLARRTQLLDFAPIESDLPSPSGDEFWDLP